MKNLINDLRPVTPAHPVAPYIGGKRILSKRIVEMIASTPHDGYAEVFVGMGGVFLRRTHAPKVEVINDYNYEVANFFRVLQVHYTAFLDWLRHYVTSRRHFEDLKATDPARLTDMQRAARFLYLQRLAFGGKVAGQNYGVDATGGARFNMTRLAPILEDVHERLSGVVIECLPWQDFIGRYDRKGMLFYLDPPYYGNECDYGAGLFSRDQFDDMAAMLRRIKGRFILSLNDRPEVREIFKAFTITGVETTYTIAGSDNAKRVGEVIITNYAASSIPKAGG